MPLETDWLNQSIKKSNYKYKKVYKKSLEIQHNETKEIDHDPMKFYITRSLI